MASARLRTRGGILRPPTASYCFFADRPIPFLDEEDTATKSVHFPASPVTTIQPVLNWIDDVPTTSSLPCPELDCSFNSTVVTIKRPSSSPSPVLSPATADVNLFAVGPPGHINEGVLPCQFDCEHCYDVFMRSGGSAASAPLRQQQQEIYSDDDGDRRAGFLEVIAREMRAGGKRKRVSDDIGEKMATERGMSLSRDSPTSPMKGIELVVDDAQQLHAKTAWTEAQREMMAVGLQRIIDEQSQDDEDEDEGPRKYGWRKYNNDFSGGTHSRRGITRRQCSQR